MRYTCPNARHSVQNCTSSMRHTCLSHLIATAKAKDPRHMRHMLKRISAQTCGLRYPVLPGVHRSGVRRQIRSLLTSHRLMGCSRAVDAHARCCCCCSRLAAPGSMHSSSTKRKHPEHLGSISAAHVSRRYTFGCRHQAAEARRQGRERAIGRETGWLVAAAHR